MIHEHVEKQYYCYFTSSPLRTKFINAVNVHFIICFKLGKAHCELNKRIFEHDKCMAEGKTDKRDVTLQVCYFVIS